MAVLRSKRLFYTTSPRTPHRMKHEIKLLTDTFEGKKWNSDTQTKFYELLREEPDFIGGSSQKDFAFSARDRITRSPKALGFVDLKPEIKLTDAGRAFINEETSEEALLRQLLKFQLPSPFHIEPDKFKGLFAVKPYLEMLRIIRDLGILTFDELMIFGIQLINYNDYDSIINAIKDFRKKKNSYKGNYKTLLNEMLEAAINSIYEDEIAQKAFKTRESNDRSYKKFLTTQKSNLRDYADACIRHLRTTGIVSISQKMSSLTIPKDRVDEVDFILNNINRNPVFINDEKEYKEYLYNATLPVLLTDNRDKLIDSIMKLGKYTLSELKPKSLLELKKIKYHIVKKNQEHIIRNEIKTLRKKSHDTYLEIIDTYNQIINNEYYDSPLMFEYNTWKAMAFLTEGTINANLKFDDSGEPMSTAVGKMPDIECYYSTFNLAVEVTLSSGMRQYESEGEPVARHLAEMKKKSDKPTYCLFIAPTLSDATLSHYYMLHKYNVSYYGGASYIIPLELDVFIQMIENSYTDNPNVKDLEEFFIYSIEAAKTSENEKDWNQRIVEKASNWPK